MICESCGAVNACNTPGRRAIVWGSGVKRMKSFRLAGLVALVCIGVGAVALDPLAGCIASAQQGFATIVDPSDTIRDVLRREFPCASMRYPFSPLHDLMPTLGCSLVRYAEHQLAGGAGDSIGVHPNDTTHIQSAAIGYVESGDPLSGRFVQYWDVVFTLTDRRRIEMHVARADARLTMLRVETLAKPGA